MKSKKTGVMNRRDALAAMAVSAVAACTSDRPTDPDGSGDEVVAMTNNLTFSPATLNISVGETVTFRNTSSGGIIHTATCDPAKATNPANVSLPAGAAVWDSGSLAPGGEFNHTFTVAGQYRYLCRPHELQAMLGTINVS
jgi:plastocyanin